MNITLKHKYVTVDDKPVRIYTLDGGGTAPVHGAVLIGPKWIITQWSMSGIGDAPSLNLKIKKQKQKITFYVNIRYDRINNKVSTYKKLYATRERAEAAYIGLGDVIETVEFTKLIETEKGA